MNQDPSKNPQAKEPNIVGIINPAEAALFAEAVDPNTDPKLTATRQRLGGVVADEGQAFALVVSQDEQGNEIGSHYINIGATDSGTKVRGSKNEQLLNLPEPSKGLELLRASEKQAAGTVLPAQSEKKFEGELDLAAIADNIDSLLAPDNLSFFANPNNVYDTADKAHEAGDLEAANLLHELDGLAKRSIFAPEHAVAVASEITARTASDVLGATQFILQDYNMLSQELAKAGSEFADTQNELPYAKQYAQEIMDKLERGEPLDGNDVGRMNVIESVAISYQTAHRQSLTARENNNLTAIRGRVRLEETQEEVRTSRIHLTEGIDQAIETPDLANFPEIVDKVAARGQRSISAHREACATEYEAEGAKIDAVVEAFSAAEDPAFVLSGWLINVVADRFSQLPSPGRVIDEVSNAQHYLYEAMHNPIMNRIAHEVFQSLSTVLSNIEQGMTNLSEVDVQAVEKAAEVLTVIGDITKLALFENAA